MRMNLFVPDPYKWRHWAYTSLLLIAVGCLLCTACADDEEHDSPSADYQGTPLLILDTDIGSSTDDLVAMALLYHYMDQGQCKLLGTVVNRMGEANAACVDAMNNFFGYPDLPIGLARTGIESPTVFNHYEEMPHYCNEQGQPLYRCSVSDYSTLPDGYALYRKLLASAPDHSVRICSIGFVNVLADLLTSSADTYSALDGVELVRRKVKGLYIMGGQFEGDPTSEYNFMQGISYAMAFFRLWPKDIAIYFSPCEVGDPLFYTNEMVLEDLKEDKANPIWQIYHRLTVDDGQRMWDALPVIHAVEGDHLFDLSGWGWVSIDDQAFCSFTPDAKGNSCYQRPGTEAWNAGMMQKIKELLTSRLHR